MFEVLKPFDAWLQDVFKGFPHLPANARKSLAGFYPWLALIAGVVQGLAAISLWNLGHSVNRYADYINSLSNSLGVPSSVPSLGLFYWLALLFLVVEAAILLMAYQPLKAKKAEGWNWLFLAAAINLGYGVASVFVDTYYGGGAGSLVSTLIGSVIAFWLLFEVRSYYKGSPVPAEPAA